MNLHCPLLALGPLSPDLCYVYMYFQFHNNHNLIRQNKWGCGDLEVVLGDKLTLSLSIELIIISTVAFIRRSLHQFTPADGFHLIFISVNILVDPIWHWIGLHSVREYLMAIQNTNWSGLMMEDFTQTIRTLIMVFGMVLELGLTCR